MKLTIILFAANSFSYDFPLRQTNCPVLRKRYVLPQERLTTLDCTLDCTLDNTMDCTLDNTLDCTLDNTLNCRRSK